MSALGARNWGRGGRLSLVLFLALGLTPGWPASAASQPGASTPDTPVELEPVVVTGTVSPTPLSHTPASVTVLFRDQIAAQQAESVSALLRHVPGLHIDQAGGRGSVSSVYLRGGDPNFTVVLLDGIKVNDPTNSRGGSFDFSTLSTDNIERIEIGRGPLSALYGSDAMSGVINIVTRRGGPQAVRSVEVTGGRFGHIRTLVQAHGMLDGLDYALSGSYLDQGAPVAGSGSVNKTFHVNPGLPVSDAVDMRWVLRYADSRSTAFPDDSGGPRLAVRRDVEERQAQELTLGMSLTYALDAWWEQRFQLGLYNRQEGITSPGVAPGARDPVGIPPSVIDNTFRRYELTWQHRFLVATGIRLALGAQAQFEEGSSIGSLEVSGGLVPTSFVLSRTIWAPFLEVQLALLPGLLVQGGVRLDLPEGFDEALSPRLGVSYTIAATQTTLRASWGKGFKLPSFFAVGHPLVGNPGLIPETSQSVDAGITQALWGRRMTVGVTYFYQTFANLIDFTAGPPPRLVNRAEVTAAGVEMSRRYSPGRCSAGQAT